MQPFDNHIALITGGSSGIGRAIACALAAQGATVCLVARTRAALDAAAEAMPGDPRLYPCDITDDAALRQLVPQIERDCGGGIDIVVHSAAAYFQGPIEAATVDQFDLQYRTNVRAPFLLTQLLLPTLKQRRGQVVFINSTMGVMTRPHVAQYAATKHALKALADSLRLELAGQGIRVISVFPGQVATPMQELRYQIEGRPYQPQRLVQPEDLASLVASALALPRNAEVTDLHIRPAM